VESSNNTGSSITVTIYSFVPYPAPSGIVDLNDIPPPSEGSYPYPYPYVLALQTIDWYCDSVEWTANGNHWPSDEPFNNVSGNAFAATVTLCTKGTPFVFDTGTVFFHSSSYAITIDDIQPSQVTVTIFFPVPIP
jgi:hypothetical protein